MRGAFCAVNFSVCQRIAAMVVKIFKKNKKSTCNVFKPVILYHLSAAQKSSQELRKPKINAGMAELADAYGSGPYGSNTMRVQVSFPALFFYKKPLKFLLQWFFSLLCPLSFSPRSFSRRFSLFSPPLVGSTPLFKKLARITAFSPNLARILSIA